MLSSTQGDTEFFGALGFGKVATLTVGANDPERTGEPVRIDVVSLLLKGRTIKSADATVGVDAQRTDAVLGQKWGK